MHWMMMPLRRYADFSGRSRRMEYWMFVLFQFLIYLGLWVVFAVFAGMAVAGGALTGDLNDMENVAAAGIGLVFFMMIYGVIWFALLIPGLAVGVRRLHDTNRSGWWILAPLGPYVFMIVANVLILASPDMATLGGVIALVGGLASLVLGLVLFVFMVLDGTPGANRYGPDPKGRADASNVFA